MKNIHIIPTDKPTGIFKSGDNLLYSIMNKVRTTNEGFHIYITSDEEIKVGDWVIEFQKGDNIGEVHFINGKYVIANDIQKKIILTTDQDLIKDGVQAIYDEFLEWFVKNPSCEYVEVETDIKWKSIVYDQPDIEDGYIYKIIIPKEELTISDEAKQRAKNYMSLKGALEPKQETLEEAGKNTTKKYINEREKQTAYLEFIAGAKWQAERMYSEEGVEQMINSFEKLCYKYQSNKDWFPSKKSEWFEQFKKK